MFHSDPAGSEQRWSRSVTQRGEDAASFPGQHSDSSLNVIDRNLSLKRVETEEVIVKLKQTSKQRVFKELLISAHLNLKASKRFIGSGNMFSSQKRTNRLTERLQIRRLDLRMC